MSCPNCGSGSHVSCDPIDAAANQVANSVANQGPEERAIWVSRLQSTAEDMQKAREQLNELVGCWPKSGTEQLFKEKSIFLTAAIELLIFELGLRAMHKRESGE